MAARIYFCIHNCTSPSNDCAAATTTNNNQAQLHTHSYTLTYQFLLISRRLTRVCTVHNKDKSWYTANGRKVGLFLSLAESMLQKYCLWGNVLQREKPQNSTVLKSATLRCNTVKRSGCRTKFSCTP